MDRFRAFCRQCPQVRVLRVIAMAAGSSTLLPAADEGDLRLVSRVDINGFATGSLQVFHNGAFGAVCENQFGATEADVACRQLGFVGGTSLPLAIRGGNLPSLQQRSIIEVLSPLLRTRSQTDCISGSCGSDGTVTVMVAFLF
eukprot:jgi/Ulvmu1/3395/UM016_0011.1